MSDAEDFLSPEAPLGSDFVGAADDDESPDDFPSEDDDEDDDEDEDDADGVDGECELSEPRGARESVR